MYSPIHCIKLKKINKKNDIWLVKIEDATLIFSALWTLNCENRLVRTWEIELWMRKKEIRENAPKFWKTTVANDFRRIFLFTFWLVWNFIFMCENKLFKNIFVPSNFAKLSKVFEQQSQNGWHWARAAGAWTCLILYNCTNYCSTFFRYSVFRLSKRTFWGIILAKKIQIKIWHFYASGSPWKKVKFN